MTMIIIIITIMSLLLSLLVLLLLLKTLSSVNLAIIANFLPIFNIVYVRCKCFKSILYSKQSKDDILFRK